MSRVVIVYRIFPLHAACPSEDLVRASVFLPGAPGAHFEDEVCVSTTATSEDIKATVTARAIAVLGELAIISDDVTVVKES